MVLWYILYSVVLCLFLYFICGRLLARILVLIARKFLKLQIKIDRVHFLGVSGLKITTGTTKIEVKNIFLRTKWSFSNIKQLFMLCSGHVIIHVGKPTNEFSKDISKVEPADKKQEANVDTKLVNIARFFAKYVGFYIKSLDIMLYDQPATKFNINLQITKGVKILFEPNASFLSYSITITTFVSKLHQVRDDLVQNTTMAETSFNMLIQGLLNPVKSTKALEEVSVRINPLKISLGDNFIKNIPLLKASRNTQISSNDETETQPRRPFIQFLPKKFDIAFTETDLFICDQEQRELSLHLDKLMCTAAHDEMHEQLSMFKTMVQLTGLRVDSRGLQKLVALKKLMLTGTMDKSTDDSTTTITSTAYIESCHFNYVHDELAFWMALFVFEKNKSKPDTGKRENYLKKFNTVSNQISFENDLEIVDLVLTLSECLSQGVSRPVCQTIIASLVNNINIPTSDKMDIGNEKIRKINCSTRLENSYIYFNSPQNSDIGVFLKDDTSVLPSSRKHIWGRAMELGSFSLKTVIDISQTDLSPCYGMMKCDASSLLLEYSQHTKHCLDKLLKTGGIRNKLNKESVNQEPSRDKVKTTIECDFNVHDINVFCVGKCQDGVDSVLGRLDMISLKKTNINDLSLILHGFKIKRLQDIKSEPFPCIKSTELNCDIFGLPSMKVNINSKTNRVDVAEVLVKWDPASHMALHDRVTGLVEDVTELLHDVAHETVTQPVSGNKQSLLVDQLDVELGHVDFKMSTSNENSFAVKFSGQIKLDRGNVIAESANISVCFDERSILQFKNCSLQKFANSDEVTKIRETIIGFESPTNKIWILSTEVYILFPYRFDFAKSFDKFLIVNKMLKQLHRERRPSSTTEPLYADLWVKLSKVNCEIEDDPFEVKLGKNYELLSDEALQWIEREFLLEQRINEVKKRPGNLLSDKKVEALYNSLSENKSKIYIERSVKLYEQDKRTRLCCWEFNDVDLMILADESMNGRDKIVPTMRRIDNASPYPDEDIEFSTLWCRHVKGTVASSTITLRDYEQALFYCETLHISGLLVGAEQISSERAQRTCAVHICEPWGDITVTRGMQPLKYFHDLTFDFGTLEMTWGVDIEPAYTMASIAFEHINKASVDPSPNLPFWDKIRLLLHGRLLMNIKTWQLNWRATRNPYDKSEQLEIEWRNVKFDWTNARFEIFGDFDLFTRTASKYDDCCVLHLPALKFCTELEWRCRDDPNNHYNIRPCAPDKLPVLLSGQCHDTYRGFRSQDLRLNISFEVEQENVKDDDVATILLYATTFRWFQNFQAVVWKNVSRPIRKGTIFRRNIPKRKPLSRHYRTVGLNLKFPQLSLFYWGSFTKHFGAELNLGTGSLHTVYKAGFLEHNDGLIRRPAANWSIIKLASEIDDVTCYVTGIENTVINADEVDSAKDKQNGDKNDPASPSKFYLGHVDRLVYKRKELDSTTKLSESHSRIPSTDEEYTHNLVCQSFRGVWSLTNRKLTFGLVDTYTRSQQLKRDLSADALKSAKVDKVCFQKPEHVVSADDKDKKDIQTTIPMASGQTMLDELVSKTFRDDNETEGDTFTDGGILFCSPNRPRATTSDLLLDQLVSETSHKFYVKTEERETDETRSSGYSLCNLDDVLEQRWQFEFINSQVMLKGIEKSGYVFVTAANAKVLNRLHCPTRTAQQKLLNKTSWMGHLENMQYFSTVGADDVATENIPWLDSAVIGSRRKKTILDLSEFTNFEISGDSVGGMFSSSLASSITQLQRIVSKCDCDFYYASFDDELEPGVEHLGVTEQSSPARSSLRVNKSSGDPVNTFSLKHPLLEISINSVQYSLILDIVSNVLLYTEPQKKEVSDLEQRMSFYFQLSSAEDLKGTILNAQNNVRRCVLALNELRRALYNINEEMKDTGKQQNDEEVSKDVESLQSEKAQIENDIGEMKANLSDLSTELRIMISGYKDFQTNKVLLSPDKARKEELMKVVEVDLDHVTWRLTQPDGQIPIVDANLDNLRYTNITMSNLSGAHSVEVGDFKMTNLLPKSVYQKVITPRGERRVGRDVAIRVYCKVKSPVGGIGVKEHFEVNLCPLDVGLTHKLYSLMMGYFFPGRAHEDDSESEGRKDVAIDLGYGVVQPSEKSVFGDEPTASHKPQRPTSLILSESPSSENLRKKSGDSPSTTTLPSPHGSEKGKENKPGRSRFYASLSETATKELDKMKERASQTNNFVYVKIPEIPICFSYKGEKEKNLVDVHNFRLNLPTLQYQNRTWTWLDLMMNVKKDYKQVLVGQVIKEKLWKGGENKEEKIADREDKAKILFGDKQSGGGKKKKKSLFRKLGGKSKSDKTAFPSNMAENSHKQFSNDSGHVEQDRSSEDDDELSTAVK